MPSPERWLLLRALNIPDVLDLRRWLPLLAMVCFGCGVAPMWPEPISEQCTRNELTTTADIQAAVPVTTTRPYIKVLSRR